MERTGRPYPIAEVLPYVVFQDKRNGRRGDLLNQRKDWDGDTINMASDRLKLFALKGTRCVECGCEGTHFYKERSPGAVSFHFNLYGTTPEGEEVLFTKDHIFPRSLGGKDVLENYQTMCVLCNFAKGCKVADVA